MDLKTFFQVLGWMKISRTDTKLLSVWFLCYVMASLLPIWGGALWNYLGNDQWPTIYSFSADGQIVLLASSLLGSLFFTLFRDHGNGRFPGAFILGPIGLLLIGASIVVFSWAMSSADPSPKDPVKMFRVSIIIYTGTFAIAIATILVEAHISRTVQEMGPDGVVEALGKDVRGIVGSEAES